jgi:ABC-type branched-subunit amino acid transport system substrate-binding protein
MSVTFLDDDNKDGVTLGQDTSALISFYGVTPVNQPDTVADATDAGTAITQINAIIDRLQELGLIA